MSMTKLEELKSLIARLQADRQAHVDAIAQIDQTFSTLGIQAQPQAKRRGRPSGASIAARKHRRPRRKFTTTGNESILSFVRAGGPKGVTGAQILQHWKAQGRGVGCYNLMGKLIKEKKIKRNKLKGERGSMYVIG
jgi:hypothetical protein